jgi:hypothetical protein
MEHVEQLVFEGLCFLRFLLGNFLRLLLGQAIEKVSDIEGIFKVVLDLRL